MTERQGIETGPFPIESHQHGAMEPLFDGPRPPVDITAQMMAFVKDQARFVQAQTAFLNRPSNEDLDYHRALEHFSHEQTEYIAALCRVLHAMGVI